MPRRNNKRNRPRDRRERGQGGGENRDNRQTYYLAPKESKAFERYYQGQGIVPEAEYSDFIETLKQPLPCTFRVTGFTSHSEEMMSIVKGDYLKNLVNIEIDGKEVPPAKCLSWYPDELAWQLDLERKAIRKDDALSRLHKFLIQETESGNISRQEAVSMIPPLLLDVKCHHKVLDMCAAPGSKTAQLIEMLHADCDSDTLPEGYVIANDSDNKRCYLMIHQISRLCSPQFLVTNMDASNLPNLHLRENSEKKDIKESLKFDRILCDVPCSGDGTLRKNVDAWHKWNPNIGHGLHKLQILGLKELLYYACSLQVRILCRGLNLLSAEGRLVYSTCSFNPVENEAVLVTVLKAMKGQFRLVDVSDKLPGLERQKGWFNWKIMAKTGDFYEKYEDIPQTLRTQIPESAFPPTETEAKELGLDRCLRILPHKQNTGGFFVAVIERNPTSNITDNVTVATSTEEVLPTGSDNTVADSTVPAETAEDSVQVGVKRKNPDENSFKPRSSKKVVRYMGYREDPFIFVGEESEPDWFTPVREYFGLRSDFPVDRLMLRCEQGKKRNVYYVAPGVRDLVQENKSVWKFVNMGVKILSRSNSANAECDYRLNQEGMHLLYPYITKRIVIISRDDVVTLLSSETPYVSRMSKSVQYQLGALGMGSLVFLYEPQGQVKESEAEGVAEKPVEVGEGEGVVQTSSKRYPGCRLVLCGYKGKVSCRSFLPKNERAHYLRLCGVELKEGQHKKETTGKEGEQLDASVKQEEKMGGEGSEEEEGKNDNGEGESDVDDVDDVDETENPDIADECKDGADSVNEDLAVQQSISENDEIKNLS